MGKLHIKVIKAHQGTCTKINDTDAGYSVMLWSIWAKQLGMTKDGQTGYLTFTPDKGGK